MGLTILIVGSATVGGIGLAIAAAAPSWPWLVAGFVLHGAGSGGLDAGINANVALHHTPSTMGYVHAGYGVGAALGPLIVRGMSILSFGWRGAYLLLATVHLVVLALAFKRTPRAPRTAQTVVAVHASFAMSGPTVFFLYGAVEVGVGQWAYTAFTEGRGVSATVAASAVTSYWAALTVGRLWLGVAGHRRDEGRLLRTAAAGTAIGVIGLSAPGALAAVALPALGLSLSVVFPVLMQLTPARVGDDQAATHIGWQAAAGALGAAAGLGAMAVAIDHTGISSYQPAALALCALFIAALHPVTPRQAATPQSEKTAR